MTSGGGELEGVERFVVRSSGVSGFGGLDGLTLGLLPPTELTDEAGGVGNPLLLNTTLGGRGLSVFRRRFVVTVAVCNIGNI